MRAMPNDPPLSLDTDFFMQRRQLLGELADKLEQGKSSVVALAELGEQSGSDLRFAHVLRQARERMLAGGPIHQCFTGVLLPSEIKLIERGEETARMVEALREISPSELERQVYLGRKLTPRKVQPLVAAWRRWRTAVYDRDGHTNRFIDGYMTAIDELEAAGKIPMMRYEERLERAFRAYENS